MSKFKEMETKFVINGSEYDWLDEINKCISISDKTCIPIPELLKEVMLNNNIKLNYENIERMKLNLMRFAFQKSDSLFSLVRTSEIFLKREDKKYMPCVDSWRSHLQIRKSVWDSYKNPELSLTSLNDN